MRTRIALLAPILLGVIAGSPLAVAQPPAPPAKPAALDAVPTDAFAFLTVNAGKLWDDPGFAPLREWFAAQKIGPTDEMLGVPPAALDRITVFMPAATLKSGAVVLVTTRKPYNEARVLKALWGDQDEGREGRWRSGNAVKTRNPDFPIVVLADDRTLMFLPDAREDGAFAVLVGQLLAKKADGPLATALADAVKHDLALGVDVRPLAELMRIERDKELVPYLSLWKARTLTFAADFDKTARGTFKLTFANEADAKRAAPVLKEGMSEIVGVFEKELARRKDKRDAPERLFLETAVVVLKAAKVETEGANVFATADVPHRDAVATFAAALPKSYSAAVNSAKGQNNLKQLALALHNFEGANGVLPGDVFPAGGAGQAWSWRVQILPYLEHENLYKVLDLTKAWDAPENLKRLEAMAMPKVFEIPGRPAPKGQTYFRIFSLPKNAKGKERPWLVEGQKGPALTAITDGLSNTLMIVEAGEAVPWYKPDVLGYDGVLPLPQLGDKTADRFIAAMGDGSVRTLKPSKLGEKTLRALITRDGGEVVTLP